MREARDAPLIFPYLHGHRACRPFETLPAPNHRLQMIHSPSWAGRSRAKARSHDFLDRFFARAAQATAQGHPRIGAGT
jgi:hypothetical protein